MNVIEYKSPDDNLSIDDFFKTLAYACLYKGLGKSVNQIPGDEITVSIFRYRYPQKLFLELEKLGAKIEKMDSGILPQCEKTPTSEVSYYDKLVSVGVQSPTEINAPRGCAGIRFGRCQLTLTRIPRQVSQARLVYVRGIIYFPTQVIVMKDLKGKEYAALRILTRNAKKEDIREFIRQARKFKEPGDRNNADTVFQVSATANMQLYEEIRKEDSMCEALRYLMRDEIAAEREAAEKAAEKALQAEKEAADKALKAEREAAEKALQAEREAAEKAAERALQAEREAVEKAREASVCTSIRNIMKTLKLTAEQAMDALLIPAEERVKYISRL